MKTLVNTPITSLGFTPGDNLDDSRFTEEELLAAEAEIAGYAEARLPRHDLTRGSTLYDLLRPLSVAYLVMRRGAETARAASTIAGIEENPDLQDGDLIDALLSNFLIERRQGSKASGLARVDVTSRRGYSIPEGAVFTTEGGLRFLASERVGVVASSLGERSGGYWFTIPIVAEFEGAEYNIGAGEHLSPDRPIESLVLSYANASFSGGEDREDVGSIRARALGGLSVRNFTTLAAAKASLSDLFPSVVAMSASGMGDPLMTRNSGNPMGLSCGGFIDFYIRTSTSMDFYLLEAEGEPVEGVSGRYRVEIGHGVLPGHMRVMSVRPRGGNYLGGYSISSQQRTPYGLFPGTYLRGLEISGSIYQDTAVEFDVDSSVDAIDLDGGNALVELEVLWQPDMAEIQAEIDLGRPAGFDVLARAFVPCVVSTSEIAIELDRGVVSSPALEASVKSAASAAINGCPPGEGLSVDRVVSAIKAVPGVKSVDYPVILDGEILSPEQSCPTYRISSSNRLQPQLRADRGYGPGNVLFYSSPGKISVSFK